MSHPSFAIPPLALTRREAIQRILAATAMASALSLRGFGAELKTPIIGFDPNLLKKEIPWPRILTEVEKRIVTVLADLIIPQDEFGPAASAVGVPDFIDEWVSAPYEPQVKDRKIFRDGFAWIDDVAKQRFGKNFADAEAAQQTQILDEIAQENSELRKPGLAFFLALRDRVAGGYYSTQEGWKVIGYVGNTPLGEFPGPSPETLKRLGFE